MKNHKTPPLWVENLKALMTARNLTPRRLSVLSGLNATAVRDILCGRAHYPRYDTVEALAKSLNVTPDALMNGSPTHPIPPVAATDTEPTAVATLSWDDLDLLCDIITKVQDMTANHKQPFKPRAMAAMITTVYAGAKTSPSRQASKAALTATIEQLLAYEKLKSHT